MLQYCIASTSSQLVNFTYVPHTIFSLYISLALSFCLPYLASCRSWVLWLPPPPIRILLLHGMVATDKHDHPEAHHLLPYQCIAVFSF